MDQDNRNVIEIGCGVAQGTSSSTAGVEAARKALLTIKEFEVSVVLVFISAGYDFSAVLEGVHSVVGEAPVLGASTSGTICGRLYYGTVSVVILASPYLRVNCGVGTNVSQDWRHALDEAVNSPAVRDFFCDPEYKERLRRSGQDCFGMLFTPGMAEGAEFHGFEIFEALREKSGGDFPLVGGGATDSSMEKNYVFWGQTPYRDSILLAVFETELQFGISLTHGFLPTGKRATATAVEGNEILAIDGEVAADVYSRLVGIPKGEMTGQHPAHVTGATIGISEPMGQHTVNIVDRVTPRGGLVLSRPVSNGVVLSIMEPVKANLVRAGAHAIRSAAIRGGIRKIACSLVSYCMLRPVLLGDSVDQDFAGMREVLAGKPLVGFLGCGEIGVAADGMSRFNCSSVACLVIGGQLSQVAQITRENNELLKELKVQSDILTRTNDDLWTEISERRKIEEALKESEERYRELFYSSPAPKAIIDPETGLYLDINQAAAEFYGYTAEEFRRLRLTDISLSDPAGIKEYTDSMDQPGERIITTRHRLRSGELRDVEVILGQSWITGKRYLCCIIMDVTARRRAEEELAHSRDRLAVVVEGAKAGICEWDIAGGQVFYDKRWKKIIGYQEHEIADTYDEWRSRWHPDDIPVIDQAMQDYLTGKTDKLAIEYRMRHRDGTYRWINTGGKLLYDQAGVPVRWTGYNIDITNHKQVEAIRAESEKRLRDFARAIPATTCIVDEDGKCVELMSGEDKVIGKLRADLEGHFLHEVLPAEIASEMVVGIRTALATGIPRQRTYETEVNGRKLFIDARAAPMECLVDGKRTVAAVIIDITEQRETERRLQFAYKLRRNSDFINDIITGVTTADPRAIAGALKFDIDFSRPSRCCLLTLRQSGDHNGQDDNKAVKEQSVKDNATYLLSGDPRYLVWDCREGIGILWQVGESDDCSRLVQDLKEKITRYAPDLSVVIGVSNANTGPNCIVKGYRQAWSAVMAARCENETDSTVQYFRGLGLFQLLAGMDGHEQTREFIQEKIGPVIEYDHKKGTDFLHTLEEILYSANLREAAEKLYLHHKTVVFRKRRIEKILGISIDQFEDRLAIATALKLYKLNNANAN